MEEVNHFDNTFLTDSERFRETLHSCIKCSTNLNENHWPNKKPLFFILFSNTFNSEVGV